MAKIFTDCGFDAVTVANNHMYDYGPGALLDTRALLLEKNIQVTGAGRDARRTLLANAILSKNGVKRVSFLPMMIDKLYRPEVLHHGDPRFDDMVRYMDWASAGFDHRFTVEGDEVVISGT